MSMGGDVGEAYIQVGAEDDTADDLARIQKKLVASMTRAAKAAGKKIIDGLEDAGDEAGNRMRHQLEEDFKRIEHDLQQLARDRDLTIHANAITAPAAAQIRYTVRDRIVNLWLRVSKKSIAQVQTVIKGLAGLNAVEQWTDSLVAMAGALPQTVLRVSMLSGAIVSLINPLLSVLSTIGPLGASLGQIFPLILAGPAAFAAMAAQVTVLAMAFTGLDKATGSAGKRANATIKALKTQFGALQDVVQENFWSGFIGPFENVIDVLMPQLEKGLSGLATVMGDSFGGIAQSIANELGSSGLAEFFANVNSGVSNAAPGLAAFAAALTHIMEDGSTLLPQFGDWITRIGNSFNGWAQNADIAGLIENAAVQLGHLWDVAKETWGVVSGIFKSMDIGKSTGLESLADTMGRISDIVNGPTFQTAMKTVFSGAASGAAALSAALVPIGDALADLAPTISYLLSSLGGAAAFALQQIAETLATPVAQEGLKAAIDGIANLLRGIDWSLFGPIFGQLGSIIGTLGPVVANLVNAFLPLVTAILPVVTPLISALAPVITNLLTAITPVVAELVDGLVPVIEALAPILLELAEALMPVIEAIGPLLLPLLEAAVPLLETVAAAALPLVEVLAALLAPAMEYIGEVAGILIDALTNIMDAFVPAGEESKSFEDKLKMLGDVATTVFTVMAATVQFTMSVVSGLIKGLILLFKGDFVGAAKAVGDGMSKGFDSVKKAAEKMAKDLTGELVKGEDGVKKFKDGANKALAGSGELLKDDGQQIGRGLVAGIDSQQGAVAASAARLAAVAQSSFKANMKIQSPSKVFEGYGFNIVAGLVRGLNKSSNDARSAIQRITNKIKDTKGLSDGTKSWMVQYVTAQGKALDAAWRKNEAVAKKLADQRKKLDDMRKESAQLAASTADSLAGGFSLTSNMEKAKPVKFEDIAKRTSAYAAKMREFAGRLKDLAKAGIPAGLLQEVASLGAVQGNEVAKALLGATDADRKQLVNDWTMIQKAAGSAGQVVADSFFSVGIAAQAGLVKGLEAESAKTKSAAIKLANNLAKWIRQALGIHSPSKVTEKIGENMTRGLLNGMGGMEDAARMTIDRATRPMRMAMDASPARMSTTGNSSGVVNNVDNSRTTTYGEGAFAIKTHDPYLVAKEIQDAAAEEADL